MREHLGFLSVSSVVVKVAAWIFLCFGVFGGIIILTAGIPEYPRWLGIFMIALYVFVFFFLYLIAKISDLLIRIINEMKKEEQLIEKSISNR